MLFLLGVEMAGNEEDRLAPRATSHRKGINPERTRVRLQEKGTKFVSKIKNSLREPRTIRCKFAGNNPSKWITPFHFLDKKNEEGAESQESL